MSERYFVQFVLVLQVQVVEEIHDWLLNLPNKVRRVRAYGARVREARGTSWSEKVWLWNHSTSVMRLPSRPTC
jgi:hypothetical protein